MSLARRLTHACPHAGHLLELHVDEVLEPGDVRVQREVVRHPGSVAILPVHDDGALTLIQQYRYPADGLLWELPAGRLAPGEPPAAAAARELEEEAGLRATHLEPLTWFFTTPGFCDERLHLFRATGLVPVPPRPEDDERITCARWPAPDWLTLIHDGRVRDAKTLLALLWEARLHGGQSR
jgi:ADP-ribose pyrophosphatase